MAESLQPQLMSVHDFFAGSLFQVPDYQRAYAWERKQRDDLWEGRWRISSFSGNLELQYNRCRSLPL